ncbi:hypothetical protein HYH03_015171 [Edaphochlamys debaryana]|uniref:Uncharacterized protein n=1 Tax=Edaphochlamys debaryana TaxID=47281 RepID=A0A835XMG3_9CHLO|nr:hypothetical protein HYH03_015171 [Edaphochlamys debaryana]|eukprot:KAG2486209.1 hypothetical protein HYH03_015171 [Edaphochlamys debaryana]
MGDDGPETERPAEAIGTGAEAEAGPSSAAVAAAAPAAGLFRRKKAGASIRKRGGAGGEEGAKEDDGDDDGGVVRKAKAARGEPLAFTTKREERPELMVEYAGSRALQDNKDSFVTRSLETETEYDRDARAQREKVLRQATDAGEAADDGQYKGMNSYIDYRKGFRREHNVGAEKGTGSHGPLRGSQYVRVSARFDYQPDVCKDYKETGYCSYGDTCKFMHDRGDYKSGWELDKMWEEEQKRKAEALAKGWNPDADGEEEEEARREDDELPFACFICRENWEACPSPPVVTRCKHYFCEKCALKHNSKTSKCAVCGQGTQGIFNVANDILKRQKRMAAAEAAKKG